MADGICEVRGCEAPSETRGMCKPHYEYRRIRRLIDVRRWESGRRCSIDGCGAPHKANGYCVRHNDIRRRRGDPLAPPRKQWKGAICYAEGCDLLSKRAGLCQSHYYKMKTYGTFDPSPPPRAKGSINKAGYLVMHDGERLQMAHRLVMEAQLGRELLPEETVHHRNGDKLDNRIENLELWSSRHPKGQRVEDKVRWALEIIAMYPEVVASIE